MCSAVFSGDGPSVLTSSEDHTAKLWSIKTGVCTQTFAGHIGDLSSAVFSGDEASVLTSSRLCVFSSVFWRRGLGIDKFRGPHRQALENRDRCVHTNLCWPYWRRAADLTNSEDHTAKLWSINIYLFCWPYWLDAISAAAYSQ